MWKSPDTTLGVCVHAQIGQRMVKERGKGVSYFFMTAWLKVMRPPQRYESLWRQTTLHETRIQQ